MPLIHLIQGDGTDLFIPAHSISWVEGFPAGTNQNAPEAIALARYNIGEGPQTILFQTPAPEIIEKVMADEKGRKDWIEFDKADGGMSFIPAPFIAGISGLSKPEGITDGASFAASRINFNLGDQAMTTDVVESPVDVNAVLNTMLAGAAPKPKPTRVPRAQKGRH